MKKTFKKLFSLHFPQALAAVFLVVIVMTIWWQFLFENVLTSYVNGKKAELTGQVTMAMAKNPVEGIDNLVKKNMVVAVTSCRLEPCIAVAGGGFLQISESYNRQIKETRNRTLSAFYWETAFLLTVLIVAFSHLVYSVLRDKRRNQERVQFLAMATHELKRPLNAASLVLQSLKRDSLPPERKDEFIDRGLQSISNMNRQLEMLLNTQELEIAPPAPGSPYRLSVFLKEVIRDLPENERVVLEPNIEAARDTTRLNQASLKTLLLNLLENALAYSQDEVKLILKNRGASRIIEIIDRGVGLSEEELNQIGQPFYRSSRYQVQNTAGSGIGLFIVNRIAEALGLSVDFASDGIKKGTRVTITLR